MSFEVGQVYTREEIGDVLNGDHVSYLPTYRNSVVCGCFTTRDNPNAPEEILFGNDLPSQNIIRAAKLVFSQGQRGEEIPVFMKRGKAKWEFVGHYLCVGMTRDPRVINRKRKDNPSRPGRIRGVLRFEPIDI